LNEIREEVKNERAEREKNLLERFSEQRQSLGEDHPDTLRTIELLGRIREESGDLEEAENFFRKALDGQKKVLGIEHPDTLTSLKSLAMLLADKLDRHAETVALLRRFAHESKRAEIEVAPILAGEECLLGNHEESKRLIKAYLESFPDEGFLFWFDDKLSAISEWVAEL
jgi:tetratricopeptide (TPR) repeat protein